MENMSGFNRKSIKSNLKQTIMKTAILLTVFFSLTGMAAVMTITTDELYFWFMGLPCFVITGILLRNFLKSIQV